MRESEAAWDCVHRLRAVHCLMLRIWCLVSDAKFCVFGVCLTISKVTWLYKVPALPYIPRVYWLFEAEFCLLVKRNLFLGGGS